MTIAEASLSINLRLNKGDSQDFDNLWKYHKSNAFNKAVGSWVRRQIKGKNPTQEGSEETTSRVDDLQVLLKPESLSVRDKGLYAETNKLPSDYYAFNRLTPVVSKNGCTNVRIKSFLREEANVDVLLPTCSFDFETTFHTIKNNKISIYHNKDFSVEKADLVYYRKPKVYDFGKLTDTIEFKDDICEILVDEACKILASDIESFNQKNSAQQRADEDN